MANALTLELGPYTFDAVAAGPDDGEPVLLLHGFPESSWSWRLVQPVLAEAGYYSVAPDLRGYSPGARPAEASAYTVDELVGDVVGFADRLGWDGFHLVGHDWGGAIAWHTAGRHPERVRTLSVASTPHPGAFAAAKAAGPSPDGDDQNEKSGYMQVFRQEGSENLFLADDGAGFRLGMAAAGLDEESIEHYYARLSTPEAMVGALNWYRGADPTDSSGMGPIGMPTLYVWSDGDVALGPTAARATADYVEGPYRFEVLEGVTHWIPEQAAERLGALLVDHLAS